MKTRYKIAGLAVVAVAGSLLLGGSLWWWFAGVFVGKAVARLLLTVALAVILYFLIYILIYASIIGGILYTTSKLKSWKTSISKRKKIKGQSPEHKRMFTKKWVKT